MEVFVFLSVLANHPMIDFNYWKLAGKGNFLKTFLVNSEYASEGKKCRFEPSLSARTRLTKGENELILFPDF